VPNLVVKVKVLGSTTELQVFIILFFLFYFICLDLGEKVLTIIEYLFLFWLKMRKRFLKFAFHENAYCGICVNDFVSRLNDENTLIFINLLRLSLYCFCKLNSSNSYPYLFNIFKLNFIK